MRSVSDFIDKLGGSTFVAARLTMPATTVASWKNRKSIPVEQWDALLALARGLGLEDWDYAALVAIHTADAPSLSPSTGDGARQTAPAKA